MNVLRILGPAHLTGKVHVSGSKNTALPVLFASLLFDQPVYYENVPRLWDIETTLQLLGSMGAQYEWDKEAGRVSIHATIQSKEASYEWVRRMRAGILALGPLVARYGEARVSLPGGCAIGARPVNFHLDAMKLMGANVEVEQGYIRAKVTSRLRGAEISFPQVSVTGTENILILATAAEGITRIENAAREPEVVALGNFLKGCGAKIEGLGTSSVMIQGSKLKPMPSPFVIPPDRIEAGTWISVAVATRSEIEIEDCGPSEMTAVIAAYREMGVQFGESPTSLKVKPPQILKPLSIATSPYPGFPTDMQAQLLATFCVANGRSSLTETIFENRFMHVAELRRLGASIVVQDRTAIVQGPVVLKAAPLMATDLRASASLVVAALAAHGTTKISRIYHLDRGYQRIEEKLSALGAKVDRVSE